MTEQRAKSKTDTDNPGASNEITPDLLMEHFKGRGFMPITLFTIAVHTVVILGFSAPYLMKTLRGTDTSKLSEKERMDIAVLEATESMRNIAQKHGLSPQDISSHFGGGGTRPATNPTDASKSAAPTKPAAPEATASTAPKSEPEKPKSAIEKELEVKTKGPTLPGTDDKDGLFK